MLSHKIFLDSGYRINTGTQRQFRLIETYFFKIFQLKDQFYKNFYLKTVSMRVNRDVNQKKWKLLKTLFFNEGLFSFKCFLNIVSKGIDWSDSQKATWTLKKTYFIMKDRLSTNISWRSYQWVATGKTN